MRVEEHYLEDVLIQFRKCKKMAERAIDQVSDDDLFATLDDEANSIAILMKHMAGNMRSRWRDFLTADGEKPDRHRDQEFVIDDMQSRDAILAYWESGWAYVFEALEPLQPDDVSRTVTIRGESHTVLEAVNRQLVHYASHMGQIVLLAKFYCGDQWQTLSIPRGKSAEFNARMMAQKKA